MFQKLLCKYVNDKFLYVYCLQKCLLVITYIFVIIVNLFYQFCLLGKTSSSSKSKKFIFKINKILIIIYVVLFNYFDCRKAKYLQYFYSINIIICGGHKKYYQEGIQQVLKATSGPSKQEKKSVALDPGSFQFTKSILLSILCIPNNIFFNSINNIKWYFPFIYIITIIIKL